MTRTLLEQQREGVEAQMHWAILRGGDQELLDLLRVESDRLGLMTGQGPSRESTTLTHHRGKAEYLEHSGTFRAMWPASQHTSPKLRAFVDHMAEYLLPKTL
jgi:hypothetical protein